MNSYAIGNGLMRNCLRMTGLAAALLASTMCPGAPMTNTVIPWTSDFEIYTNSTPLINGTNGWYASSSSCIVDTNFTGGKVAMLPIGETLENRFLLPPNRNIKMLMYVQPQISTSAVYPRVTSSVAAQFFINSNGYFVVGNGNEWNEATNLVGGGSASSITNINNTTNFVKIQVNLQYNTHTWSLKAWTNETYLVAYTNYLKFASNVSYFTGFVVYNGSATSYLDNVSVSRFEGPIKVNGASFDTIKRFNDTPPVGKINGVSAQ